jgi:hypothetical protein
MSKKREIEFSDLTKIQESIIQRDYYIELVDQGDGLIKSAYLLKSKNPNTPLMPSDYIKPNSEIAFLVLKNGDKVSLRKVCEYLEDCLKTDNIIKKKQLRKNKSIT